ncbi:hypothetical protein WDJ50_18595 (plasmid) [Deinococcus sp. VB142]|uniref:Uncharacterized protein n=1 Tax=Deinococcus sp. VB142 TaxID=3112952 RepID=A0AAU6Q819_9DEIO
MKRRARQSPVVSSTVHVPPKLPPLPMTEPELAQFIGELMQATWPRVQACAQRQPRRKGPA